MAQDEHHQAVPASNSAKRVKLTGRAFYESIGSPKMIVAPMVDRSEFAWRLLTRSYLDETRSKELLAYTPMFHARLFKEQAKFRDAHFQPTRESMTAIEQVPATPFLDGHPQVDRPLFVQFCANKPEDFLEAAQYVAPYCDAVDLNLGCPQGIAKSGHYGAFLQEDWDTIHSLIRKLRDELAVPVTAKFRIQESREKTLEYAKMILDAGASIITVHGRQRHQKGHNTGIADWSMIRFLRENLPPDTVIFANGNVLNAGDIEPCLTETGADGVMSAEGNLSDPTIFARPPDDENSREYWRDPQNAQLSGYRIDGVFRRYLDIIYRHVLEQEPPQRKPIYLPGVMTDVQASTNNDAQTPNCSETAEPVTGLKRPNDFGESDDTLDAVKRQKPSKKQKTKRNKNRDMTAIHNPNLKSMQGHLFQLLRPMLSSHTHIRDALARSRAGDIAAFENVLSMVEEAVKQGLDEVYAKKQATEQIGEVESIGAADSMNDQYNQVTTAASSEAVRERCRRPFWICQPHVRPLPEEAIKIGAMTMSKKEREGLVRNEAAHHEHEVKVISNTTIHGGVVDSKSQAAIAETVSNSGKRVSKDNVTAARQELPKEEALACG